MNAPDLPVQLAQAGSAGLPDRPQPRGAHLLQLATLLHVASLVVFTSWDFGGETDLARVAINGWGLLAVVIMGSACTLRWRRHKSLPSGLRWLWPLACFNALVIASAQNPSFTRALVNGAEVLMNSGGRPGWPSSAQPVLSLRALCQFDAIYLTCFNLTVVVIQRRILRRLLFVFTANSLLLAVMGTFQKLAHAPGLYFGMVHSPNETFFAASSTTITGAPSRSWRRPRRSGSFFTISATGSKMAGNIRPHSSGWWRRCSSQLRCH